LRDYHSVERLTCRRSPADFIKDIAVPKNKTKISSGGEIKMKIKPMNDRVLVLRVQEEQKTSGGIIIPDTAKEKPQEGRVVSVGPGKVGDDGKRTALDIKAGDRVLFGKYAGMEIKIDGVEHVFMREDDILGVLE